MDLNKRPNNAHTHHVHTIHLSTSPIGDHKVYNIPNMILRMGDGRRIWIQLLCRMYEFIGHRVWIHTLDGWIPKSPDMNSYFGCMNSLVIGYGFTLFDVWIHIWRRDVWAAAISLSLAAAHTSTQHLIIGPDQLGCVRLPRPVKVCSAAPTN